jgi:hypothetical protein
MPSASRLRFTLNVVLFTLALNGVAQAARQPEPLFQTLQPAQNSLENYRWHKRLLVIFAPSDRDTDFIRQMALLQQQQDALRERDIVVLSDVRPADGGALRAQLNPAGFEIVLVGKDGGMKLRETRPVSAEALLSLIDRMPMRQAGQN